MLDPNVLSIGYDVTYELDQFGKPRLMGKGEMIKNIVLFLVYTKPGQYPSLPYIGLDLESRLYSFYDEIKEDELRDEIVTQCNALGAYFSNGSIIVKKYFYKKKPSLMIDISVIDSQVSIDGYLAQSQALDKNYLIGITYDELNKMISSVSERSAA